MSGFSGVGKVTSYTRTAAGLPGIGTFWGNCPKLTINQTPNVVERNSSMTVDRGPLRRMTQSTGATIEIVCDEFNKKNFARAAGGRIDAVVQAPAQTYTIPVTTAAVGDTLKLPHTNVSNVVITDSSSGTAKTLPAASYDLDAFDGSFQLLDITTGGQYTQPFVVNYDKGAVSVVSGLALPDQELWLGLAGTNADSGERGILDVYRVRFAVADVLDFINNDYQDYTMKGTVLSDPFKAVSDIGGQYYKFSLPTSVA